MSSLLRRISKRKAGGVRPGLGTRGEKKGPAQTSRKLSGAIAAVGAVFARLTEAHDLSRADPECRRCHGLGRPVSALVLIKGKQRDELVCGCVPYREE